MSYKNLINKSLVKAFTLLKDLAVDGQLTLKGASSFDFATGTASATTSTVDVKVVKMERVVKATPEKTASTEVIVRSSTMLLFTAYDTILIDGVTYTFAPTIQDNGFITMATIVEAV